MVASSFRGMLWSSFKKTQGLFFTIASVSVGIAVWLVKPDLAVPAAVILPIAILALSTLIVLFDVSHTTYLANKTLPKVVRGYQPGILSKEGAGVLLLEPSDLFAIDSVVSIFYREDGGFERLAGMGYVLNIQTNGFIQVLLPRDGDADQTLFARLANCEKGFLENTIVKPTVPRNLVI